MSGFSLIWITSSFDMSWKYWIMMDYGKTKKVLAIDWLISVGSLISSCLTQWFDLFNHNPKEQKYCGKIGLIRTQALKVLWASVHILTHALNNFCLPYGRQLILYCLKLTPRVTKTSHTWENRLIFFFCIFMIESF